MSLHKFGYYTEQLKLREYQELEDLINSQEKLAQMTHSKFKDFENELENESGNLLRNQEYLFEEINRRKNTRPTGNSKCFFKLKSNQ